MDAANGVNDLNITEFLRTRRALNRSPRTIQSYEEALLQLVGWLDGTELTDAAKEDLEDWITHLLREHKPSTAANRFRSIRVFYNWAVAEEIIDKSPMARMNEPAVPDDPPQVLEDDALKKLLKVCEGPKSDFVSCRDTALIRQFCEPGTPRVAEMAGIELPDVDMRRNVIRVVGKGRKIRYVPFGNKTGTALARYIRVRAKHPAAHLPQLWLGAKRQDKPLTASGIAQMLERRAKEAGIDHVWAHLLRHTSKHNWDLLGGSEADAEELFGWTPGSGMARVYGRSAKAARARQAAHRISPADRL